MSLRKLMYLLKIHINLNFLCFIVVKTTRMKIISLITYYFTFKVL